MTLEELKRSRPYQTIPQITGIWDISKTSKRFKHRQKPLIIYLEFIHKIFVT